MADPNAQLKGIPRRNTPAPGHNTKYRSDGAAIGVDLPKLGPHWVFEAYRIEAGAFSDTGGGIAAVPPPSQ